MPNIAVIDIGKTNAKLALVDGGTLAEAAVLTCPNRVLPGPPWPHFDLARLWEFLLDGLSRFHKAHGVAGISVTTHGAAAVLLDRGGNLAAPMLDYEHRGPEALAPTYDALRPAFAETGSPRLGMGLNLGAQLHWQLATDPDLRARVHWVVTYPQYWGHLLTGELACDLCSLGCHTDLWNPWSGTFSTLVDRLDLAGRMAPPRLPTGQLGTLLPRIAQRTGIPAGTPVAVGIHDSNASLLPYLKTRDGPFAVVSTGTWVVAMAMGGRTPALDPARDVLVNVNALGQPVPSARFMGGREFDLMSAGLSASATDADRAATLRRGLAVLPAVEPGSGPFPGRAMSWHGAAQNAGESLVALSWYLALMTDTCLTLIGAEGPVVIEGPFTRNRDFLDMLACLRDEGVETAASSTGTAIGAALLMLDTPLPVRTLRHHPKTDTAACRAYAAHWRAMAEARPRHD